MVDTYAGFALENAPQYDSQRAFAEFPVHGTKPGSADGGPGHLYEVILEGRPCWLYFDLEYSRGSNPGLEPEVAMSAFRAVLADFCADAIGAPLDESSLIELDSSTPQKFSKHVLVKRLRGAPGDPLGQKPLAFANNAQAGLFVSELLAYAQARRSLPASPACHLFVRAPPSARDAGAEVREVSLVDESVYSRNRSFRLLFHAKFGKSAALKLSRSGILSSFDRSEYPPLQLLRTMASFVPEGTPFFTHAMIPPDYGHAAGKVQRVLPLGRAPRAAAGQRPAAVQPQQSGLLQHLIEAWDGVRKLNERSAGSSAARPTTIQSAAEMDRRFMTVTLENNRFCFCKGASHVSNHVYLVVDRERGSFHQKCFDIDCRHFCSPPFPIPAWLLEEEAEDAGLFGLLPARPQGAGKRHPPAEAAPEPSPPEKCARAGTAGGPPGPGAGPPRETVGSVASPQPRAPRLPVRPPELHLTPPRHEPWPKAPGSGQQRSPVPDSDDDEPIGADPDEMAVAQGVKASQEGTDWFDVDNLW